MDHSTFLSKTLNKFNKHPRKRTQLVQEAILPWLRSNKSIALSSLSTPSTPKKTNKLRNLLASRKGKGRRQKGLTADTAAASHIDGLIQVLLEWWKALMGSVRYIEHSQQTPYLESIVEILSREEFISYDHHLLASDLGCETNSDATNLRSSYLELLNDTVQYAINSANASTVHPGSMIFCAHVLALGFFKLPGLAYHLLNLLPVQRRTLSRIRQELLCNAPSCTTTSSSSSSPLSSSAAVVAPDIVSRLFNAMPNHLHPLMKNPSGQVDSKYMAVCTIKFGDHWISRWQTSDRAFYILFYQRYHLHLRTYIDAATLLPNASTLLLSEKNPLLAWSPGYLHFAAYMADKIVHLLQYDPATTMASLLLNPNSTTTTTILSHPQQQKEAPCNTMDTQASFEIAKNDLRSASPPPFATAISGRTAIDESSNNAMFLPESRRQSLGADTIQCSKPMVLRSMVINMSALDQQQHQHQQTSASGKPRTLDATSRRYAYCLVSCGMPLNDITGLLLFRDMLNVWIRTIAKQIRLTVPTSVFCFLDFVEDLFVEIQKKDNPRSTFDYLDLPFVIHTLNIILVQCDNTIVQMRALAFIYTQFASLTESHPEYLTMLCNRILLHPFVFERYLTHWHSGIRVIFLQCLFWRLRPVWCFATVPWKPTPASSSSTTTKECNGKHCWHRWHLEHPSFTANIPHFRKCRLAILEVHIAMETILSAFHRQYDHLQSMYGSIIDPRERHAELIRLEADDVQAPTPFLPGTFASTLNRPEYEDASHRQQQQPGKPKSTRLRASHSREEQQKRATRRLSNIYNHTTRRLSAVFSSSATSLPSSPDEKFSTFSPRRFSEPKLSLMGPTASSTRSPLPCDEYYLVPDAYKSNTHKRSMVTYFYHTSNSSLGVDDHFSAHGDKVTSSASTSTSTSSSSSRCGGDDSAYASGTSTPIKPPMVHPDVSISESIQDASTWQYSPLVHKYAIKAVEEMERIAKCKTPPAATSLSVDWPKAWSFPMAL